MSSFGLGPAGFRAKRREDIKADLESGLKNGVSGNAGLGVGINLRVGSGLSQFVGLVTEGLGQLWDLGAALYMAGYPDTAQGVPLDNVGAITFVKRQAAAKSSVSQFLFGTAGTVVPADFQFAVDGFPTSIFNQKTAVTLVAGSDEQQKFTFSGVPASGTYQLGFYPSLTTALAYNAAAAAVQTALRLLPGLAGITVTGNYASGFTFTFAGVSGKQPWAALQAWNNTLATALPAAVTMTWSQLAAGVAQGEAVYEAATVGPTTAGAFSLTSIVTPLAGLTAGWNQEGATVGQLVEPDASYRSRRNASKAALARSTVDAIRTAVLAVTGVTTCTVYENDSNALDAVTGTPARTLQVVVEGGTDQAVADALFQSKGGAATYGTSYAFSVDSQGFSHTIYFTRPTALEIYLDVVLTKNSLYPTDGDSLAAEALKTFVNGLGVGDDVVVYPQLVSSLNGIPGIIGIALDIGTAPSPSGSANIAIGVTRYAELLDANLSVS